MAKKQYTRTKLSITATVAGLTMLTATWLAPASGGSDPAVSLASTDVTYESVQALATATPAMGASGRSSTTSSSATVAATATPTTAATSSGSSTTSSSTSKTSRAS